MNHAKNNFGDVKNERSNRYANAKQHHHLQRDYTRAWAN